MTKLRPRTLEIRQFIIESVADHPTDLAALTARTFGITVQGVANHLQALVRDGSLTSTGNTRAKRYVANPIFEKTIVIEVEGLEEHVPWENEFRPFLKEVPRSILKIISYGFTEMLNNVIDHSQSDKVRIGCLYTPHSIRISIRDFGIGIFRKIREALQLEHERQAIFELAKGKLTTDPDRHSGEGVFFTSRVFDIFEMYSGMLFFSHVCPNDDWLIEPSDSMIGTVVNMTIALKTDRNIKDVFDRFTNAPEEVTFCKTHVPLKLAQFGTDNLISRSQAKRIVNRFDRFEEVVLDFTDVEFIGQGFADELFRVFQKSSPKVRLTAINTSPEVLAMIDRTRNAV